MDSNNTGGVKYDQDKAPLSLISQETMILMGQALAYGAKKYSSDNYKLGMMHRRPLDAALRHLFAYAEGEDFDQESGCHHIGSALASLNILAYMIKNFPELDNRHKKGPKNDTI